MAPKLFWPQNFLTQKLCVIETCSRCDEFLNVATFLGSGAGAFLGALLGGLSALKKK